MKKQLPLWIALATLCLLVTVLRTFAQTGSPSLLWKITGPGLGQPSYIFGTFHLLCPEEIIISDSLKSKMAATRQLYLELDFDDPTMMQQMQASMTLPAGQRLTDYCSPADSALLDSFVMATTGAHLTQLAGVKPLLLMQLMFKPMLGCQPDSWEMRLVALAQSQQKQIFGLETIADQMGIFDAIPNSEQVGWTVGYLRKPVQARAEFTAMIENYRQQNVDQLADLIRDSPQFRAYADQMLWQRNRNWAEQIPAIARQQPTFFAVGAGHLGGKKGVIELLQQKGYTVIPAE